MRFDDIGMFWEDIKVERVKKEKYVPKPPDPTWLVTLTVPARNDGSLTVPVKSTSVVSHWPVHWYSKPPWPYATRPSTACATVIPVLVAGLESPRDTFTDDGDALRGRAVCREKAAAGAGASECLREGRDLSITADHVGRSGLHGRTLTAG